MKALSLIFAVGLMSLLISEGLGICIPEDVCDDDLCKGYCAIEGFPPGTNKCIYGDSCPYDSPLVCKCA